MNLSGNYLQWALAIDAAASAKVVKAVNFMTDNVMVLCR